MGLPTPINWLRTVPTAEPVADTNDVLMLFHVDDMFEDDEQLKMIIQGRIFNSVMGFMKH